MNLELFDSYGHNFPEEADGTLDCGSIALTCRFNRWGSLLAVGCNDGRVMIFDFTTRGIAKVLSAHVQPGKPVFYIRHNPGIILLSFLLKPTKCNVFSVVLCKFSWNRNGRLLVTASSDNTVAVWDILTGECCNRFRFNSLIIKVQFHSRNDNFVLVCPLKSSAVILRLKEGQTSTVTCDDDSGNDQQITIAAYDRRGNYIITGNIRGMITILDAEDLSTIFSFRLQTNHPVRLIETARRGGNYFLTSSNDRVIKIFDLDEVLRRGGSTEPVQKLQDLVNKTPWKVCCFSGDSEYVCAGSGRTHALYIWERNSGSLVKILHGIKGETLLDVVWHPAKPLICSISNGMLSIWSQTHVENWSAFAPDFKELEENIEYEERESEFDLEDDDKSVELNAEKPAEDIEVDVVTVGSSTLFFSSDEEGEPSDSLWYLPVAPDVDDPEEPPIGFILPAENQQASSSSAAASSQNVPPAKKSPPIIDVSLPAPKYSTEDLNPVASGRKKTIQPRPKRKNKNDDAPYK